MCPLFLPSPALLDCKSWQLQQIWWSLFFFDFQGRYIYNLMICLVYNHWVSSNTFYFILLLPEILGPYDRIHSYAFHSDVWQTIPWIVVHSWTWSRVTLFGLPWTICVSWTPLMQRVFSMARRSSFVTWIRWAQSKPSAPLSLQPRPWLLQLYSRRNLRCILPALVLFLKSAMVSLSAETRATILPGLSSRLAMRSRLTLVACNTLMKACRKADK